MFGINDKGAGERGQLSPLPWWYGGSTGQVMPFKKNLSRVSASSENFDLLSFCQCPPLLSKDGFRDSFKHR